MINQLIQESEARQAEEFDRRLKQALWAMENRRQEDMLQVSQALDKVRFETGNNLVRTQRMMNDLIVLTGSGAGQPVTPRRVP